MDTTISWKTTPVVIIALITMANPEFTVAGDDAVCLPSDFLIENARIYTADDQQWTADALAVRGDRIVFVGSANEATQWRCGAGDYPFDIASFTRLSLAEARLGNKVPSGDRINQGHFVYLTVLNQFTGHQLTPYFRGLAFA